MPATKAAQPLAAQPSEDHEADRRDSDECPDPLDLPNDSQEMHLQANQISVVKLHSYYLAKSAYFCLADDHYVFLDLRNDEYLCLSRNHSRALNRSLTSPQAAVNRTGNHSTAVQLSNSDESVLSAVVQALARKELLIESEGDGKALVPTSVEAPVDSLVWQSNYRRTQLNPNHVWHFLAASANASKELRYRSLEQTVRTVKASKIGYERETTSLNHDLLAELYGIFHTLRPYYPRRYLCLFDSLALLHFLARYDVFPQWVYGVKLEPFNAHCWVQAETLVVNDTVETVRDYTPIMSI